MEYKVIVTHFMPPAQDLLDEVGRDGWDFIWMVKEGDAYHTYFRRHAGTHRRDTLTRVYESHE